MFRQIILAYGGIDSVIVTAGVFISPDTNGYIPDEKWRTTFDVNVIGSYLIADEAYQIWQAQGLKGSLVLTSSANAAVVKKGSFAYDTSKAALNHLIRELAVDMAPLVRVNGLAPATVVEGSSMFPTGSGDCVARQNTTLTFDRSPSQQRNCVTNWRTSTHCAR